jgi:hypothetical protein
MRYDEGARLRIDAAQVSHGVAANQSQEGLDDQLKDLLVLATRFGLYDAADWLKELLGHRDRYALDYGEPLPTPGVLLNDTCHTIRPVGRAGFINPCGAKRTQHTNGIGPCNLTGCDAFRLYGEYRAEGYSVAGERLS